MYLVVQLPCLVYYGANEQNKTTHPGVDVVLKWLCLKIINVSQSYRL